jgi:hypothetical protein
MKVCSHWKNDLWVPTYFPSCVGLLVCSCFLLWICAGLPVICSQPFSSSWPSFGLSEGLNKPPCPTDFGFCLRSCFGQQNGGDSTGVQRLWMYSGQELGLCATALSMKGKGSRNNCCFNLEAWRRDHRGAVNTTYIPWVNASCVTNPAYTPRANPSCVLPTQLNSWVRNKCPELQAPETCSLALSTYMAAVKRDVHISSYSTWSVRVFYFLPSSIWWLLVTLPRPHKFD